MELTAVTALTTLLPYRGGKAFDKVLGTTTGEVIKGRIEWLKSFLFKDDKYKETLEKYAEKCESGARRNATKATIQTGLADHAEAKRYLLKIAEAIEAKTGNNTTNSKNDRYGDIHSVGHIVVSDQNQAR